MKKKFKIKYPNANNLQNLDWPMYEVISLYGIDHTYLASQMYVDEWDDDDPAVKKQLTGKLRNKLDGRGKITDKEYTDLLNIIHEIGSTIVNRVIPKSEKIKLAQRNQKIEKLLKSLDEETLKQLKDRL